MYSPGRSYAGFIPFGMSFIVDDAGYTIWLRTLGSMSDLRANGDNTGAIADKIDQAE